MPQRWHGAVLACIKALQLDLEGLQGAAWWDDRWANPFRQQMRFCGPWQIYTVRIVDACDVRRTASEGFSGCHAH